MCLLWRHFHHNNQFCHQVFSNFIVLIYQGNNCASEKMFMRWRHQSKKKNWNMKNQGKYHKWLNEIEQNISENIVHHFHSKFNPWVGCFILKKILSQSFPPQNCINHRTRVGNVVSHQLLNDVIQFFGYFG